MAGIDRAKLTAPLTRLPFLAAGLSLFALKIAIDWGVARLFDQPYSPLFYVSPMDAPLMHPEGRLEFWLMMWAVAVPFIALGVWLTLRRLLDARLPPWLVVLFFVPFANLLFFVACAAVPSHAADPSPATGYREPPAAQAPPRSAAAAVIMGAAAGAVIALGMVAISVGLLGEYGAAMFLGAPTISGHVATLVFCRLHGARLGGAIASSVLALAISFVVMLAFAIEGAVCLVMTAPLAGIASMLGCLVAYGMWVAFAPSGAPPTAAGPASLSLLPIALILEVVTPLPHEGERMVESVIEVDAPPDVVWPRVIAFPDLPPPDELIFRAGVASPTGAVIEGEGVGAVRRCRFTTGEFVEPITVWRPGQELSFDVAEMPDPMRELTPFDGPRPPHLDGYLGTTRGQFLLQAIDGGRRTRLSGRTWYVIEVTPRAYWAMWSDAFIHTIHLRVMRQIERLAEEDAARLAALSQSSP